MFSLATWSGLTCSKAFSIAWGFIAEERLAVEFDWSFAEVIDVVPFEVSSKHEILRFSAEIRFIVRLFLKSIKKELTNYEYDQPNHFFKSGYFKPQCIQAI